MDVGGSPPPPARSTGACGWGDGRYLRGPEEEVGAACPQHCLWPLVRVREGKLVGSPLLSPVPLHVSHLSPGCFWNFL